MKKLKTTDDIIREINENVERRNNDKKILERLEKVEHDLKEVKEKLKENEK
jgi:hypothetical protein